METVQWLRVPVALAEDQGSESGIHMAANNCLQTPVPEDLMPFTGSAHTRYTNIHTEKTPINKNENTNKYQNENPQNTLNS